MFALFQETEQMQLLERYVVDTNYQQSIQADNTVIGKVTSVHMQTFVCVVCSIYAAATCFQAVVNNKVFYTGASMASAP
jgi:hypothetical protein